MKKFPKLIVGILIGRLQSTAFGQSAAIAQSSTGIFTVNVNTPGTFRQIMLQTVENWSDVAELTNLFSAD